MANVYIATGTLYLNGTTYEYGEVVAEGDVPTDRLRTLIRRGLIDISSDGGGGWQPIFLMMGAWTWQ